MRRFTNVFFVIVYIFLWQPLSGMEPDSPQLTEKDLHIIQDAKKRFLGKSGLSVDGNKVYGVKKVIEKASKSTEYGNRVGKLFELETALYHHHNERKSIIGFNLDIHFRIIKKDGKKTPVLVQNPIQKPAERAPLYQDDMIVLHDTEYDVVTRDYQGSGELIECKAGAINTDDIAQFEKQYIVQKWFKKLSDEMNTNPNIPKDIYYKRKKPRFKICCTTTNGQDILLEADKWFKKDLNKLEAVECWCNLIHSLARKRTMVRYKRELKDEFKESIEFPSLNHLNITGGLHYTPEGTPNSPPRTDPFE